MFANSRLHLLKINANYIFVLFFCVALWHPNGRMDYSNERNTRWGGKGNEWHRMNEVSRHALRQRAASIASSSFVYFDELSLIFFSQCWALEIVWMQLKTKITTSCATVEKQRLVKSVMCQIWKSKRPCYENAEVKLPWIHKSYLALRHSCIIHAKLHDNWSK